MAQKLSVSFARKLTAAQISKIASDLTDQAGGVPRVEPQLLVSAGGGVAQDTFVIIGEFNTQISERIMKALNSVVINGGMGGFTLSFELMPPPVKSQNAS